MNTAYKEFDIGVSEVFRAIEVEACYSDRGEYSRWMKFDKVFNPAFRKWENYSEDLLLSYLRELEGRGKVQYNLFERIVRIEPVLAKKQKP